MSIIYSKLSYLLVQSQNIFNSSPSSPWLKVPWSFPLLILDDMQKLLKSPVTIACTPIKWWKTPCKCLTNSQWWGVFTLTSAGMLHIISYHFTHWMFRWTANLSVLLIKLFILCLINFELLTCWPKKSEIVLFKTLVTSPSNTI